MGNTPRKPAKRPGKATPISLKAKTGPAQAAKPTPTDRLADSYEARVAALDRERDHLHAEIDRHLRDIRELQRELDHLRPTFARAESELSHARGTGMLSSVLNVVGGALMGAAGNVAFVPKEAGLFAGMATLVCGVVLQVTNRPPRHARRAEDGEAPG